MRLLPHQAGVSTAAAWLRAWTFCFTPVWKAPWCLVPSSCRAQWQIGGTTLADWAAASPLSWNQPWGYSPPHPPTPSGMLRPLWRGGADLCCSVTQLCCLGNLGQSRTERVLRWFWGIILIISTCEIKLEADLEKPLNSIRIPKIPKYCITILNTRNNLCWK